MNFRGIISSFNAQEGQGAIILSNGQRQEFSVKEWKDEQNEPRLGLEVVFSLVNGQGEVSVPSAALKEQLIAQEKAEHAKENSENFSNTKAENKVVEEIVSKVIQNTENNEDNNAEELGSFDDVVANYKAQGFNLVKNFEVGGVRTANLRSYVDGDFKEVTLEEKNGKLNVKALFNGKEV